MVNKKAPADQEAPTIRESMSNMWKQRRMSLPLTPLIDVTFMLLLYFLLTSTFREPEQQLMAPVPSRGGEQSVLLPIHVTLEPAGPAGESMSCQVGDDELTGDVSDIRQQLYAHAQNLADPEVPVIIHADQDVRWTYVVEVFNAATIAGFEAITFAPPRSASGGKGQ